MFQLFQFLKPNAETNGDGSGSGDRQRPAAQPAESMGGRERLCKHGLGFEGLRFRVQGFRV